MKQETTSSQSKIFTAVLRMFSKMNLSRRFIAGNFSRLNCPEPPLKFHKRCSITKSRVNGRNVFTLRPVHDQPNSHHILYLHGGSYTYSFFRFHWKFLVELVEHSGCTVTAPDYPLSPKYNYKDSFAIAEILYKELINKVVPSRLVLMGDSAGGGFALALAQKMRNENIAPAGQIILLSPWLDVSLNNPDIKNIDGIAPLNGVEILRETGHRYAGDLGPEHYLVSPVRGSLTGLGKISLFIGSRDILAADARKLKALAGIAGVEINYFEYPGMMHDWMLLNFPESKRARQQIVALLQE